VKNQRENEDKYLTFESHNRVNSLYNNRAKNNKIGTAERIHIIFWYVMRGNKTATLILLNEFKSELVNIQYTHYYNICALYEHTYKLTEADITIQSRILCTEPRTDPCDLFDAHDVSCVVTIIISYYTTPISIKS